ncbi:hypothetical protein AAKU61_002569 [Undibacterium sp. GrIS 1.2]
MGRPPDCTHAKHEAWKFFDVIEGACREPKALFDIFSTHRESGRTDDGSARRHCMILMS